MNRTGLALSLSPAPPGQARSHCLLIHGAASTSLIWGYWQRELALRGWSSVALDLRGHGRSAPVDLSRVSMSDYESDVRSTMASLTQPLVLIGWSMGGLVALMAARHGGAAACVCIAPSAPAREREHAHPLRTGTFGPEEYGIVSRDPADQPTMPDLDLEERKLALSALGAESRLARDDRRAGVAIRSVECPVLIVTGSADEAWPRSRYDDLPFEVAFIESEGASHWGLMLNRRLLPAVASSVSTWLEQTLRDRHVGPR